MSKCFTGVVLLGNLRVAGAKLEMVIRQQPPHGHASRMLGEAATAGSLATDRRSPAGAPIEGRASHPPGPT